MKSLLLPTRVDSERNDYSQLATAALKPTSCFSEGVIKEGVITRSGRQVKLPLKATEAHGNAM